MDLYIIIVGDNTIIDVYVLYVHHMIHRITTNYKRITQISSRYTFVILIQILNLKIIQNTCIILDTYLLSSYCKFLSKDVVRMVFQTNGESVSVPQDINEHTLEMAIFRTYDLG